MDTDVFFGHHFDPLTLGGKAFALGLAVLLGGLIGLERQWRGNAAGMRTHILVCLGSTVMTMTSVEIGLGVRGGMRGDPGHIAAQIVSGVGFLGAGAILRDGATVHGLTTAASVWATAGIGIALGASPRLGELAVMATVTALATLTVLSRLEEIFKLRPPYNTLEIEVREGERGATQALELVASLGIEVFGVQSEAGAATLGQGEMNATRQMRLRVRLPRNFDRDRFNVALTENKSVVSFHLD